MALSMPSEELQLLIAGYVLGDLDPAESAEFERLLATDPAIAVEVTQMQKALELSYAPAEVDPPDHLRSTILSAVSSDLLSPSPSTQTPAMPIPITRSGSRRSQRRALPWTSIIGAVAATLIAALGINNYRLWQELKTLQANSPSSEEQQYVLQGSDAYRAVVAEVVVNPVDLEASLTIQNLPPLPPGKVYAFWTVLQPDAPFTTDPKGAILTGVFRPDTQGNVMQIVSLPPVFRSLEFVAKVAVTIENAASPQNHQGTPILITDL
jgi:anti-sigma-K factor RskA